MDNREAKFLLSAYRPSGQDADDPCFAEALEQARRDPVLERCFNESIAFDATMTEKLRAVEVPPDLRENILAGVKDQPSASLVRPIHQMGNCCRTDLNGDSRFFDLARNAAGASRRLAEPGARCHFIAC